MADEEQVYGITLEDRMSGPAKEAASSVEQLASSATSAKSALQQSGEAAKEAGEGKKKAATEAGGLRDALGGMSDELDVATGGMVSLAGEALIVAGVAMALGAALAYVAVKGALMAIEATQGKQAMVGMFAALGGGIDVGVETEEMLGDLSNQIGITKDELAPLTKSFMAMGIEGTEALRKVTLAAASAQAIMGDPAAAQSFENLTKKIQVAVQTGQGLKIPAKGLGSLADMGIRVDDVAKKMNVSSATLAAQLKNGTVNAKAFGDALQDALIDKGAGPLQKLGNSLTNIKKMWDQNIGDLFEDLGDSIDPFLAQVKDLLSIFSQNTASGKAMKNAIGTAFTYIFTVASHVVPYIKHFFLDLIIWSLKGYIMLKQHWSQIKPILMGVGTAIGVVVVTLGVVIGVIAAVVAAAAFLTAGFLALVGSIGDFANSANQAGKDFIDGLVGGILGGVDAVKNAATSVATAAYDGVKDFLGIASRSKLMVKAGGFAAEGLAGGMDEGAADVESSGQNMGAAAAGGASAGMRASDYAKGGGGGGDSSGGAGGSIQIAPGAIVITAPQGVTDAATLTEIAVAAIFERLALQQGA